MSESTIICAAFQGDLPRLAADEATQRLTNLHAGRRIVDARHLANDYKVGDVR